MRRKRKLVNGEDVRGVAIYTRKSVITNKGDSTGVQHKQSADYAMSQLSLPEGYEFLYYEDKGLSGYYSDRPDFQRMLHDIEAGKIRAVACYKLDRISRKTSDLMRLLEYFERHDVTLLVCSNNINTQISTSKIIIQVLAIIAEFERDILTERIQDNLMELSKDGRWMGGTTPTGFSSERVATGSGKNKSAISFLVPIPEEKALVQKLYATFLETRSLHATAAELNKNYTTKNGARFTVLAVKDILKNPIYCTADALSYQYFLDSGANIFGGIEKFDANHGLAVYNKTDQMKVEDYESTFFNPKYVKATEAKPIEVWVVSVGKHEGFIPSERWITAQKMMTDIAERHNRPHRKTNALLSGLLYCPLCGKPLRVIPESNRWTNGKPRFKYVCTGFRKKTCTYKALAGVEMDEFIVKEIAALTQKNNKYHREVFEAKLSDFIRSEADDSEYQRLKDSIDKLHNDIAAQVRNLREADESVRRFIQEDISSLTAELQKQEAILQRMKDEKGSAQELTEDINEVRKKIYSFAEFAKSAKPEVLVTLLQTIVERVYVTYENSVPQCHIFLKGCLSEDYTPLFGTAEYIGIIMVLPIFKTMCDSNRGRKCNSLRRRGGTPSGMFPYYGKTKSRRTHRKSKAHKSL